MTPSKHRHSKSSTVHIPFSKEPIHIPLPREQYHHNETDLTLLLTTCKRSSQYQLKQFLLGYPTAIGDSLLEVDRVTTPSVTLQPEFKCKHYILLDGRFDLLTPQRYEQTHRFTISVGQWRVTPFVREQSSGPVHFYGFPQGYYHLEKTSMMSSELQNFITPTLLNPFKT